MAPANTGSDNNKRIAVTKTDHANNGIRSKSIPNTRRLPRVLIKFTAPKIELTPARCKEKIAKSTEPPAWATFLERGAVNFISTLGNQRVFGILLDRIPLFA